MAAATSIFIVTNDSYLGNDIHTALTEKFGDKVEVQGVYRVYHMPELTADDIVISTGTCKDHDGSGSYPVYFDVHTFTRAAGSTLISLMPGLGLNRWIKALIFSRVRRHLSRHSVGISS